MKKLLFIIAAITLLSFASQAQTPLKVHSDGTVSLQSTSTSYGIQIPTTGVASFEPNVTSAFGQTVAATTRNFLSKAWAVKNASNTTLPVTNVFYSLGNGNVFAYGSYLTYTPARNEARSGRGIEGASEKVSAMRSFYYPSHEFDGVSEEELTQSDLIKPEALEGILEDYGKEWLVGLSPSELEEVLPEAVRHDNEGNVAVNYSAVVAVLVEAFKEQQARIEQLEAVLKENGLTKP